jgi:diguanylate cyclase (GGDEF)-like protein
MARRCLSMLRAAAVPLTVAFLGALCASSVMVLQGRSDGARRSQLITAQMRYALQSLGNAPFEASPQAGGSPTVARALIQADQTTIARSLRALAAAPSPPRALTQVGAAMTAMELVTKHIYRIGAYGGGYNGRNGGKIPSLQARQEADLNRIDALLRGASRTYARSALTAKTEAVVGSVATIALLVIAFALIYRRSVWARRTAIGLAAENGRLLDASRIEAITDALTGLGNRRALIADLESRLSRPDPGHALTLALFDLDGFKEYNDTFGHPAGDALLTRLGTRLAQTVGGAGTAYRMGGDEFCVLAEAGNDGVAFAAQAAAALNETGDAFTIGCSYGAVRLHEEAGTPADAIRIADDRMYDYKGARASARRQSTDVLLAAVAERAPALNDHVNRVATLAADTALALGLSDPEVKRIVLAAELHDVGKLAIPDSILNCPGLLDEDEWCFIRQHTLIGERILNAAPSLAPAAQLVRASHERHDGHGYPDRLAADAIPVGAQIIAVCDAYDAMTSTRPYSKAIPHIDALNELRRCAGSQFHPGVVDAFCVITHTQPALHHHASPHPGRGVEDDARVVG